jgi:hypothetical protein
LLDVHTFSPVLVPGSGGGGSQNTPPAVSITSPANSDSFASGTSIRFSGSAMDAEDGDLTGSLVWTSSRDGQIGTGGSFDAVLSAGTHTITASVTDSGGLPDSASITVIVDAAAGGTVTVASLVDSSYTLNKNFWKASIDVTIDPTLSGAVVSGAWGDGSTASCTTDGAGQCTVSTNVRTKTTLIDFDVSGVALAGYTYTPSVSTVTADMP